VAGKHPYSIDRCERRDLFDLLASNFNQRTKPTIMLMIITETMIMLAIAITLTAVIAVPRWVPFASSSALPSLSLVHLALDADGLPPLGVDTDGNQGLSRQLAFTTMALSGRSTRLSGEYDPISRLLPDVLGIA
jgi:hypothetical protein